MYVKWTGDLQRREQRSQFIRRLFLFQDSKHTVGSSGNSGGVEEMSCGIERELSVITSNYSPISRSIYL